MSDVRGLEALSSQPPASSLQPPVKRIAILGSTGSIGQSALAVVDAHADRLQVVGLAAGENAALLAAQVSRYRPAIVSMASEDALADLRRAGVPPSTILMGRPLRDVYSFSGSIPSRE